MTAQSGGPNGLTETETARFHWGAAAFLFSLDLGAQLASLAVPDTPMASFRAACRRAIVHNRESVAKGSAPLLLRDEIGRALEPDDRAAAAPIIAWIETELVTPAQPRSRPGDLLSALNDPTLLARIDADMTFEPLDGAGYAAVVHSLVDPEAADQLMNIVFDIDDALDLQSLSDWDRDILTRNKDVYAPDNPLALLIHTLTQRLLREASARMCATLGAPRTDRLVALCRSAEPVS